MVVFVCAYTSGYVAPAGNNKHDLNLANWVIDLWWSRLNKAKCSCLSCCQFYATIKSHIQYLLAAHQEKPYLNEQYVRGRHNKLRYINIWFHCSRSKASLFIHLVSACFRLPNKRFETFPPRAPKYATHFSSPFSICLSSEPKVKEEEVWRGVLGQCNVPGT